MTAKPLNSTLRILRWPGLFISRMSDADRVAVRSWLWAVAVLVALMVTVGGATRLTDSGLSITEWRPVTGVVPPMSQESWQEEFLKYQTIPEYQIVNRGMSLDDFKEIYWWEWGHRFLGRVVGAAFFFPFLYFLIRRKLTRELGIKLAILFAAGGFQGALGWFMVQSGLSDRVDVSQYRLAAHLCLAFAIIGGLIWVASDLNESEKREAFIGLEGQRFWAAMFAVLVFFQVFLGAFVAGLRAGYSYNTWPLMDGGFLPGGYFFLAPWYANFFENAATVQFNHRIVGYLIVLYLAVWCWCMWNDWPSIWRRCARIVGLITLAQVGLGIWALVAVVPIWLGLAHQAGALALFSASIYLLHLMSSSAVQNRSDCSSSPVG